MGRQKINPMDMLFAGHTAKEVYEAKKRGERFILNQPVMSERAKWKRKQMETVKDVIDKLGDSGLVPKETIFIFTGKKKHPVEMSECIVGEEQGVVFHAVAVHSSKITELLEEFTDIHWLRDNELKSDMERLFIAKVLLHEIGHFINRKGNGMRGLSGEDAAEEYSWEHLSGYLKSTNLGPKKVEHILDCFSAVHQATIQDYWLYLDEKREKSLKAEINRLKHRVKELER